MKPLRLAKVIALSFALGAILSVGSDPKLMHQAQTIALSKASAIATNAMQSLGKTLDHWLKQGQDAAFKEFSKQLYLNSF